MDITKARVLHISKYYYPFYGGTEHVARSMVKALLGTGASQKVICFNEDASDGVITCKYSDTTRDVIDGVEVVRCGYFLKVDSQAISTTYKKELSQIMNQFKPNVIILHYPNPFVTQLLLRYKNLDYKLLVYWHLDITKQRILKHFFHGQILTLINRADRILGATPNHLNESKYTPRFGEKKYILPYMIDEDSLELSQEEIELGQSIRAAYKGKVLGFFIGRHVPYKGLTYLIKASKEMNNSNVHFLLAGEGVLTKSLKSEASGDDKITFLGRISDSERKAYLYASDIICFPSVTRNEGFGIALAEGMYFGHPAVTFKIKGSGVNYVNLDGVTGIECPNGDYISYAKAIEKLVEDKEIRNQYGKAARQRVIDNFTSQTFKKNMRILIESL